jgi:hypothetical protein
MAGSQRKAVRLSAGLKHRKDVENMQSENEKTAVLVKLPKRTTAFLDAEVAKTEKRFGVKSGRAPLLRAVAEALEAVRFPLAYPSPFHLRDELVKALNAIQEVRAHA